MSSMRIKSRENPNLEISVFRGHFATRHSHNSHYLDITRMKHEYGMAADAAGILVQHYIYEKQIDTIVCMDGSEVIGTFLAACQERPLCRELRQERLHRHARI